MERLHGLPLSAAFRAEPPFSARELLLVIAEVADALSRTHEAGVIHRDVKPGNIFLHRADKETVWPKVLDFGVSKMSSSEDGVATTTGSLLGSPRYMSPEQTQSSGAADARRTHLDARGETLPRICPAN